MSGDTSKVTAEFRPEEIILFGSHARGTAGQDSDADILVVMPVKGSKRKKATEIDIALVGLDLPVDLIVVTPEELERNKKSNRNNYLPGCERRESAL